MLTFSQRMGLTPVRTAMQVESLDNETRNAIWNLIYPFIHYGISEKNLQIYRYIWTGLYHKTSDSCPGEQQGICAANGRIPQAFYQFFRQVILKHPWNECLDFVEFIADEGNQECWSQQYPLWGMDNDDGFAPSEGDFNALFEQYLVGYRFVGGQLTQITDRKEIETIESATENAGDAVKELLDKALRFLSDRKKPDYAKSVECSISAVESQCRILLNGAQLTLNKSLIELNKRGVKFHPALMEGFGKLYGYASNADNIRHGGSNPSDVDQALATYMLVSCSAFVNYLITKGIDIPT